MITMSRMEMADEIATVKALQAEARNVAEEDWAGWVNAQKDRVRLSGSDGYVPDQEEWIKRCHCFLVCMGAA